MMNGYELFKPEKAMGASQERVRWFEPFQGAHGPWKELKERKKTENKRGKDSYLLSPKKTFENGKTWAPSQVLELLGSFARTVEVRVRSLFKKQTDSKYKTYLDGAVDPTTDTDWHSHVIDPEEEKRLARTLQAEERSLREAQARKNALQDMGLGAMLLDGGAGRGWAEGRQQELAAQQDGREQRARAREQRSAVEAESKRRADLDEARRELERCTSAVARSYELLRAYRWKTALTCYARFHVQWILGDDMTAKILHEKSFREAKMLPEMTWEDVRAVIMRSFTREEDKIELLEDLVSARRKETLAAWLARIQSMAARLMGGLQLTETKQSKKLWVDLVWRQVTATEVTRVFGDKKPKTIAEMITVYQGKVADGSMIPKFDPTRVKKQTARLLVRPSQEKAGTRTNDKADKGGPGNKKPEGGSSQKRERGGGLKKDKGSPRGRKQMPPAEFKEFLKRVTCWNCGKKGHRAKECPHPPVQRPPGAGRRPPGSRIPRAAKLPPVRPPFKRNREQYATEEETEVVINFDVRRETDGFVAVHAEKCPWLTQAAEVGHGEGYCRYAVADLEEQRRGDLFAPQCCKKELTEAGHMVSLDMMAAEVISPFAQGARY